MSYFKDKVAVVTGGASGVGRGLCEELARAGAKVVVSDINLAGAEQVSAAITALGGQSIPAYVDVADAASVQKLVDTTVRDLGRLDFMFNNAGVGIHAEVRDMNLDHWNRILDINLKGVIHGVMSAYPVMLKQGSGHIVNTSSGFGLFPMATHVAYGTTKHGVVGLSLGLRQEAADLGVKVTVACLGVIETPMAEHTLTLGIKNSKDLGEPPFPKISAEECARLMLRGVEKNKGLVTLPKVMTLTWLLHRINPALLNGMAMGTLRKFRQLRTENLTEEAVKKVLNK